MQITEEMLRHALKVELPAESAQINTAAVGRIASRIENYRSIDKALEELDEREDKLRKQHAAELAELEKERRAFAALCDHPAVERVPDPSGNNGGYYYCSVCRRSMSHHPWRP